MDEILYLEPDEEITSVIDKLKKAESKSVGLVIPRNSGLIHSIVNLKLLKKEAASSKKDISLVTADKIGKNIASQVGITVYEDVHAKRPVNAHMPELPKGDEVIEVDMSDAKTVAAEAKVAKKETSVDEDTEGGPKIRHYSAAAVAGPEPTADEEAELVEEEIADLPPANAPEDGIPEGADSSDDQDSSSEPKVSGFTSKKIKDGDIDENTVHGDIPPEQLKEEPMPAKKRFGSSFRSASGKKPRFNRGLVVFVSIFLVIILLTLTLLPQTYITVTVAAETFEKEQAFTVDKEAKEADPEKSIVPGKLLEINNDDAKRVPATGKKDVGGKSKGSVVVSNSYSSSENDPILSLKAGTEFTGPEGKVFTLDNAVKIPPATIALESGQIVTKPGTVSASITAKEPGDSYNIKASRFSIAGLSAKEQEKIYADSSKDFTGGFTKTVTIMTQADIDGAKDTLVKELAAAGAQKLRDESKDMKLLEEAINSEVLSVKTNPSNPDSETEQFDIEVKAKHQVMVFDEKLINKVVLEALKQITPENKELLVGEGDEFSIRVDKTEYNSGTMTLQSHVKTKVGTRIDAKAAKQGLAGKNAGAIEEQLKTLPDVKTVDIDTFPRWWWQDTSFMPFNTRLSVVYE